MEVVGQLDPPAWTARERLRLNFPPHCPPGNRRLRLACQVCALPQTVALELDSLRRLN